MKGNDSLLTIGSMRMFMRLTHLLPLVAMCRRLLSREKEPLVNDVIRSGIVPKLVAFLSMDARWVNVMDIGCS